MSISAKKKQVWDRLSTVDKERIVRMAWEDRSTFDSIREQFGLSPNEVVHFMRTQLDKAAYIRWRRRANTQGQLKHSSKRSFVEGRFKSTRQRMDGSTKGWK